MCDVVEETRASGAASGLGNSSSDMVNPGQRKRAEVSGRDDGAICTDTRDRRFTHRMELCCRGIVERGWAGYARGVPGKGGGGGDGGATVDSAKVARGLDRAGSRPCREGFVAGCYVEHAGFAGVVTTFNERGCETGMVGHSP